MTYYCGLDNDDPGAQCETCRFYSSHDWIDEFDLPGEKVAVGHCLRHAPRPFLSQNVEDILNADAYAVWPTVRQDFWCGDYQRSKRTTS